MADFAWPAWALEGQANEFYAELMGYLGEAWANHIFQYSIQTLGATDAASLKSVLANYQV